MLGRTTWYANCDALHQVGRLPRFTSKEEAHMMKQKGFTLIELMIVVAIIGILAAIAIPAYQDYTVRSKVTEAVAGMSAAKVAISEYYQSQGSMPAEIGRASCRERVRTTE